MHEKSERAGAILVLFDIDGTLLRTRGAGLTSMYAAGRSLFGDRFTIEDVDFAGRLDRDIWKQAAQSSGIDDTDANHARFRAAYTNVFNEAFERGTAESHLLPGVPTMLDRLHHDARISLGIVTGNYPETGRIKLERAGIDPSRFGACAWGCDGTHRRELPPLAMRRHTQISGLAVDPRRVVVIGDTPHDIDCARHAGCRSIAVATGPSYSLDALSAHAPDHLAADLTDTEGLVRWILNPS